MPVARACPHPGRRAFAIEDGRIIALALHREIDPRLGHAVEVDIRWRLLKQLSGGPPLTYDVLSGSAPTPTPVAGREPRAAQSRQSESPAIEPILALERLRQLQQAADGFIVITDTANPPRLPAQAHRAVRDRLGRRPR